VYNDNYTPDAARPHEKPDGSLFAKAGLFSCSPGRFKAFVAKKRAPGTSMGAYKV